MRGLPGLQSLFDSPRCSRACPLAKVATATGGARERSRPGTGPGESHQGIAKVRELHDCLAEHSAARACHALSTWALVFVHGPRAGVLDAISKPQESWYVSSKQQQPTTNNKRRSVRSTNLTKETMFQEALEATLKNITREATLRWPESQVSRRVGLKSAQC